MSLFKTYCRRVFNLTSELELGSFIGRREREGETVASIIANIGATEMSISPRGFRYKRTSRNYSEQLIISFNMIW